MHAINEPSVSNKEAYESEAIEKHKAKVISFNSAIPDVCFVLQVAINVVMHQRIRENMLDSQIEEEASDQEVSDLL